MFDGGLFVQSVLKSTQLYNKLIVYYMAFTLNSLSIF